MSARSGLAATCRSQMRESTIGRSIQMLPPLSIVRRTCHSSHWRRPISWLGSGAGSHYGVVRLKPSSAAHMTFAPIDRHVVIIDLAQLGIDAQHRMARLMKTISEDDDRPETVPDRSEPCPCRDLLSELTPFSGTLGSASNGNLYSSWLATCLCVQTPLITSGRKVSVQADGRRHRIDRCPCYRGSGRRPPCAPSGQAIS